ncbi:DUF6929 family protein [Nitrosomonas communis]|uniref:DUF6929 family protein n=1 Tax=Nitrosomonas communis TaxID=44574 RepID=UPI003D2C827A
MHASIRNRIILQGLQSASGIERIGNYYYIVSDDSPDLYRLDLCWNVVGTARLFPSDIRSGDRIPKAIKPDLEAMCLVEWHGKQELLCFGSGSKAPTRDICYRVDVTDPTSPQNMRPISLTALYDILRADPTILGTQKLNLEGATTTRDAVLLFQRGNISGINALMQYPLATFMNYLDGSISLAPIPQVSTFTLPKISNRYAGFSAALTWNDSILFAASLEDTDNEIDDGVTLGSFIGMLQGKEILWVVPVESNGSIAPVKIEGIAILQVQENLLEIACVTDNDMDASEILRIEIK